MRGTRAATPPATRTSSPATFERAWCLRTPVPSTHRDQLRISDRWSAGGCPSQGHSRSCPRGDGSTPISSSSSFHTGLAASVRAMRSSLVSSGEVARAAGRWPDGWRPAFGQAHVIVRGCSCARSAGRCQPVQGTAAVDGAPLFADRRGCPAGHHDRRVSRIARLLGIGGMGRVYKGVHPTIGQPGRDQGAVARVYTTGGIWSNSSSPRPRR